MIWILSGVIVIETIVCGLLLIVLSNLNIQNLEMVEFIENALQKAYNTYYQMKEIDLRGAFAADDEVGWTFTQMLEIIQEYAEFLGVEIEEGKNAE